LLNLSKRQKTLETFFKDKRDIQAYGDPKKQKKLEEFADRKKKILNDQLEDRKKLITKMR
jgi:hypothetical protein